MKKLIGMIIALFMLSSICVLADEIQCQDTNELELGQLAKFQDTDNKIYEIKIAIIAGTPNEAKLSINGEITDLLAEDENYKVSDGKTFVITDVNSDSVDFCVDGHKLAVVAENFCSSTSEIEDGVTSIFKDNDGNDYEIKVVHSTSEEVKLSVNGEITDSIAEGESYKLPNAKFLTIDDVGGEVEFCINGEALQLIEENPCFSTNTIEDGQLALFKDDSGNLYEIKIVIILGGEAKLSINGEITKSLSEDESYKLSTGEYLTVTDASGGEVEFCIASKALQVVETNSCSSTNEMQKGETNSFEYPNGKVYEIKASILTSTYAKFEVNGEVTDALKIGESHKLSDGDSITVKSVSNEKVSFCIGGVAGFVVEGDEPEFYCRDSDNGLDYYNKGYIHYKSDTAEFKEYDECGTDVQTGEDVVQEKYCTSDNTIGTKHYHCSEGCKDGACMIPPKEPPEEDELPDIPPHEGEEDIPEEEPEIDPNACEQMGIRKDGKYCSTDKKWENQIEKEEYCDNNFECKSNICVDSKCISGSLIQKIISWFANLFN